MKKKALSFFLALVLMFALTIPFSYAEEVVTPSANVKVESVQGYVSQFVDVKVSMATDMDVTIINLAIKYDPRLELVSFANGALLENTYSSVNGEENGTFFYIGDFDLASKTTVSAKNGDVILTLKFKIPENATVEDSYNVSILDTQSVITTNTSTDGVAGTLETDVVSKAGVISVLSPSACESHTLGAETVVRTASYFSGGYSYKTCSSCGHVDATITSPTATNAFTLIGTAIRYSGNPSGIGAHFQVNTEAIKGIEALGYKVELGIELVYGDSKEKQIFYGSNTPEANRVNYEDGVISACIEGIKTQQKGNIYAYITMTDESGAGRTEKTYATLHSNKNISIADVVNYLNLSKYTQESRDYLNAVANGFESE